MGKKKIWIEVCLISGRGLIRRSSSLWKLQWYAVGWIHPHDHKYCTKIDASGKPNPVWKTGFSTPIEFDPSSQSQPNFEDLALHVEVYSRDPIFLRESLLGSATILLKEFLDKYYYCNSDSDARKPVDEVGSFQLRKRNSNKPLGFVDVSIRISEERREEEEPPTSSYLGADEGFNLDNFGGEIKEGKRSDHGSLQPSKHNFPLPKSQQPQTSYQMPIPPYYPHHPPVGGASYSAAPPRAAAPPAPPPSNVGYIPNFFPMTSNHTPSSYINMPSAGRGGGVGAGFGTGVGAGSLAAGAVIFGDDFMSGFHIPAALRDASATISTYPPF